MPPDKYKYLEEIRKRKRNVRIEELKKLLIMFGFRRETKKESYFYVHPRLRRIVHIAKHKEKGQENKVFVCYVRDCIKAIDELIAEGGEGNGEERP